MALIAVIEVELVFRLEPNFETRISEPGPTKIQFSNACPIPRAIQSDNEERVIAFNCHKPGTIWRDTANQSRPRCLISPLRSLSAKPPQLPVCLVAIFKTTNRDAVLK